MSGFIREMVEWMNSIVSPSDLLSHQLALKHFSLSRLHIQIRLHWLKLLEMFVDGLRK